MQEIATTRPKVGVKAPRITALRGFVHLEGRLLAFNVRSYLRGSNVYFQEQSDEVEDVRRSRGSVWRLLPGDAKRPRGHHRS
jgi:hypothetical protein